MKKLLLFLIPVILISGCVSTITTTTSSFKTTPISSIVKNTEEYLNKNITVSGRINTMPRGISSDKGGYIEYFISDNEGYKIYLQVSPYRTFQDGNTYTLNGVLVKAHNGPDEYLTLIVRD